MRIVDALASRRGFAVALILLVAVGGYLRGVVSSEALAEPPGLTLCHGATGGTPSGDAVNHSCCDDCVLAAAAVPAAPPTVSEPVATATDAGPGDAIAGQPAALWMWTPRQSQGPPRG